MRVSARVSAMRRPRGVWQKLADLRKRAKPLGLGTQYLGRLRHIRGMPKSGIPDGRFSAHGGLSVGITLPEWADIFPAPPPKGAPLTEIVDQRHQ